MATEEPTGRFVLRILGEIDDIELDDLYRSMRRELDDSGIDATFVAASLPEGAKSASAVIAGIAIPFLTTLSGVFAQTLQAWLTRKRPMCTLQFEAPGGARIEVPSVRLDNIDDVIDQWRKATLPAPEP